MRSPEPTGEWETGPAPAAVRAAVDAMADACLADPDRYGLHLALVAVHEGRVVAERYGPTAGPDTNLVSWSMAKSVTHALVGLCIRDGLLDLHAPAPVPTWAGDERAAITLDQLLAMCDGLDFARSRPLTHPPGTVWNYSSGTTNIVAAVVGDAVTRAAGADPGDPAARRAATEAFLRRELFGPLGMASADPRFDAAGTFIGSSFLYATARDFARFGLLYLRDGVWNGRRILPEGWAAHARTPAPAPVPPEDGAYGRHWWLHSATGRPDTIGAHGFEGQYTIVRFDHDAVIVRLGKTPAEKRPAMFPLLSEVVGAFD